MWPIATRLDTVFTVTDVISPDVRAFIRTPSGEDLYLFICRSGDDPGAPSNVNYAGDLDCRLISAKLGEIETNLLVEDSTLAAWYSRGRMFATELEGASAGYPEYGLTRDFFLRGMRLTMQFSDVHADGVHLKGYRLRLRVTPDSTAQTAIAAKSGYLDPSRHVPGRSCDHVQRGDEWPARRPPG